jgi:hypothetical protein
VSLKKLTVPLLGKKFPEFYESWNFITRFKTARHLSLSWARSSRSTPYTTLWTYVSVLSSHLSLGLPSVIFPSVHPPKLCMLLSSHPARANAPSVSFLWIWSPKLYFVRSTDYKIHRSNLIIWANLRLLFDKEQKIIRGKCHWSLLLLINISLQFI